MAKISKIIERLEYLKEKNGDVEVMAYSWNSKSREKVRPQRITYGNGIVGGIYGGIFISGGN